MLAVIDMPFASKSDNMDVVVDGTSLHLTVRSPVILFVEQQDKIEATKKVGISKGIFFENCLGLPKLTWRSYNKTSLRLFLLAR